MIRVLHKLILASAIVVSTLVLAAPPLAPGYRLEFPRDHGSHPEFRTEWWYITGWLQDERGNPRGFQITFFRVRNEAADANPSKFAPRQLLFAHAALSDPRQKHLLRAERSARAGFGLAEAREGSVRVHIDDWSLENTNMGFQARIRADDFAFDLQLTTSQPPLLHGDDGFSMKGPQAVAASYYYSVPQLQIAGRIVDNGATIAVHGTAWFDHEWSNIYVDPQAVGWDWIGLNLANGDAVMAFRMRDEHGAQRWAAATWRGGSRAKTFMPAEIAWTPLRRWRSPITGVEYPIEWRVDIGEHTFTLRPLMDDQESDARGSVGILYWEGAVEARDERGAIVGRGYLELTGYGEPVRL